MPTTTSQALLSKSERLRLRPTVCHAPNGYVCHEYRRRMCGAKTSPAWGSTKPRPP